MSQQLVLIDDIEPEWHLDERTRTIGLRGIKAARDILRRSPSTEEPSARDAHGEAA